MHNLLTSRFPALHVLLVSMVVGLSACGTVVYQPQPSDKLEMTLLQAVKSLHSSLNTVLPVCVDYKQASLSLSRQGVIVRCPNGVRTVLYQSFPNPGVDSIYSGGRIWESDVSVPSGWGGGWIYFRWDDRPESRNTAINFAKAWRVMARLTSEEALTWPGFESDAKNYRTADVKPELPEAARPFKIQAEVAVREKRLPDAAERYEQALLVAPWWPQGHFNLGLVLGEMGFYPEAIGEMKRYLALVQDAKNARAVQDKIYEWQAKVPKS